MELSAQFTAVVTEQTPARTSIAPYCPSRKAPSSGWQSGTLWSTELSHHLLRSLWCSHITGISNLAAGKKQGRP